MSVPLGRKYLLAVFLVMVVGTNRAAFAQNPTFALEGVVTDAQQAVLPGATVTVAEHRHRAHPYRHDR